MQYDSVASKIKIVVGAFFAGIALGVVSRLWMRWISTDPEFSWGGTISIVGAFTSFITAQSLVMILRRSASSRLRSSILRTLGVVFTLPLFNAGGVIMLPTVALASVALWTGILQRRGKIILLALSLIIPAKISLDIVGDFGLTIVTLGRILLFLSIYTLVIFATRPTLSPNEDSNAVRMRSFNRKTMVIICLCVLIVAARYLL